MLLEQLKCFWNTGQYFCKTKGSESAFGQLVSESAGHWKGGESALCNWIKGFLFLTGSITLSQIIYTTNNTKQSKSPTPAKSPTIAKSPTTDNNNHEYEMGIWTSYSRSVPPKVNERTTWWSTWFKWGFRRHKWRHFGKTIQASIRAPSGSASLSRHTLRSPGVICNITDRKSVV